MNPKTPKPTRLRRSRKLLGVQERRSDGVRPDAQDGTRDGAPESPPDSDVSYRVGYGRPPKDIRFKPGKSGNPKGRAPQSRNLKTIVKQVLEEMMPIKEGGRIRRMAAIEALVRVTRGRAFKGDRKALDSLFGMMKHSGYGTEAAESAPELLQGVDHETILKEYLARLAPEESIEVDSSSDRSTESSDPSKRGKA
jgi:hypothetical protein